MTLPESPHCICSDADYYQTTSRWKQRVTRKFCPACKQRVTLKDRRDLWIQSVRADWNDFLYGIFRKW